jgi:hypothetical protein
VNITLSGLLIFLFVLPGLSFRWTYLGALSPRDYSAAPLSAESVYTLIAASLIQVAMVLGVDSLTHYQVDFRAIEILLMGSSDEALKSAIFDNLHRDLLKILLYESVACSGSGLSGALLRKLAMRYWWDSDFAPLRLGNDWFYILTGREWRLGLEKDFDYVWIDALVTIGAATVIYSGVLSNFYFSVDGNSVETIALIKAQKWASPGAFSPTIIPGNYLLLKYSEINNLNVTFIKLAEVPTARLAITLPQ